MWSLHLSPIWLHNLTDLCYIITTLHTYRLYTCIPPSVGFSDNMSHVRLLVRSQLALAEMASSYHTLLLQWLTYGGPVGNGLTILC